MTALTFHEISINEGIATKRGPGDVYLQYSGIDTPDDLYRLLDKPYPKFFKMDLLCRWAWVGAEWLLASENGYLHDGLDKTRIAVALFSHQGCIEADKKYRASMQEIPSPALFVYTLPNIMLGELCIRHGFKGEQLCMLAPSFEPEQLRFWAGATIDIKGMDACLAGWVDTAGKLVYMTWMSKEL